MQVVLAQYEPGGSLPLPLQKGLEHVLYLATIRLGQLQLSCPAPDLRQLAFRSTLPGATGQQALACRI